MRIGGTFATLDTNSAKGLPGSGALPTVVRSRGPVRIHYETSNVHACKALVSAAWKYTYAPYISVALRKRQERLRGVVINLKAERRLWRYQALKQGRPRRLP